MSYVVTARKWRPALFEEVIGQEHITITLKNAIKNNRIAHAYIFAGPRGVGKTTTARILAKTLNCLHPKDAEPCNECEMCKSFNSSQSLDIIEIDGASNRRIDEIRTLRESVKYAPTKGKYKVYIIDEVHMLTTESFNALLKTLEEPPEYTIFIFATTDVHKVPLTIISRCQRFDFRRIELNPIKKLLKKIADEEKIKIDDQSLTIIAKKADGALRDAESIFDQIIAFSGNEIEAETLSNMLNLINEDTFFTISDAILDKKFAASFEVTKMVYEKGWNFIDFLNGLIEHFRNILTINLSGNADLIESAEIYKEKYFNYKNKFTESDLLRILNFLNKTQQELRYTQNHRLKIEIALCSLIGLEKSSLIKDVIQKLEEIKKKVPAYSVSESNNLFYTSDNLEKKETPVLIKTGIQSLTESSSTIKKSDNMDLTIKWKNFIQTINNEKILVASALSNLQLVSLESNKLNVHGSDESINIMLNQNKKFIDQRLSEFFGKTISLNNEYSSTETFYTSQTAEPKQKVNNGDDLAGRKENSLIDSIKKELKGEEIN
ncbi:MAG: DNA polymerase III subunit gamma/tau [Ignavibacteriales bacterium]|nr:DNA polymerase III subunit gamma/tau [Ignavibacteriales bacterium]